MWRGTGAATAGTIVQPVIITQPGHGFALNAEPGPLSRNPGGYIAARGTTADLAEVWGWLVAVLDADTFTMIKISGVEVPLPATDDLGAAFVDGEAYFVSILAPAAGGAGRLTRFPPEATALINKPIVLTTSATTGDLQNMRGAVVSLDPASPGAHFHLPLLVPGDWADLNGVADPNTKAYASAGFIYDGLAYRIVVADDVAAVSGGIYRDISALIPNVGDEIALIATFGHRRVNHGGNSVDFYAWFGVGNRAVGGVMDLTGAGHSYLADGMTDHHTTGVQAASLALLANSFNNARPTETITVFLVAERTGAAAMDVDRWTSIGLDNEPAYFLSRVTAAGVTSPNVHFGLHVNNNGHDGEMVIYGYRELTVAQLTAEYGLTKP